jgi:hypothetical protein
MNNTHGLAEIPIQETGGTNIIFGIEGMPLPITQAARPKA